MADIDLSVSNDEYIKFAGEFNGAITKKHMVTRQNASGSSSCRLTALLYIYVYYLRQSGKTVVPSLIWDNIQALIDTKSEFGTIVGQNMRHVYGIPVTSNEFNLSDKPIHFMGMVTDTNIISHYFLIVKRRDGYYLISSYGSDKACIHQYETKLSLVSWYAFIDALQSSEIISDDKPVDLTKLKKILHKRINDFILKYFLSLEHKTYGREEDPMGPGTHPIPTDEDSISEEVKGYLTKRYQIVSFPEIVDGVETSAPTISGGKKTRRVKKVKRKTKRYSRR